MPRLRYSDDLEARYQAISERLRSGVDLDAKFEKGELSFAVDSVTIIERIFLSEDEGAFVAAQWKVTASTFVITERTDGKALCKALLKLIETDNAALKNQIVALEK